MAIDINKIKWAENLEIDPVSGLPNKSEPPEELKLSGTKRAQNLTRQHFNFLANQYYSMLGNLQQQINDLTVSAGVGTLQAVFPVGSYWFNGNSNADPATSLGFGTWVRVKGRFIVGVDEVDTTWDAGLKTGGNKNHAHTASSNSAGNHSHGNITGTAGSHNHGGNTGGTSLTIAQMPSHTHGYLSPRQAATGIPAGETFDAFLDAITSNTSSAGSGQAHSHTLTTDGSHTHTITSDGSHTHTITVNNASNVPPFEAAFIWRRTA